MPLIECLKGGVSVNVGGLDYSFERDQYQRFVARVDRPNDVKCFMGNDLYRIVSDVPEAETSEREARRIAAEQALAAAVAEEERLAAEKAAADELARIAAEQSQRESDAAKNDEDDQADEDEGDQDAVGEKTAVVIEPPPALADPAPTKRRGRPSRKG